MKYFSEEIWKKLPVKDFRARFFVEAYLEKLSMYTPHFYQSRLMSTFSSCAEARLYIDELKTNEKNKGYILSALDEIDSCWKSDPITQKIFLFAEKSKNSVFKAIRGETSARIR